MPDEIYAGIPVPVTVLVENPRRFFPVFLIRVYMGETTVLFPYIRPRAKEQRFVEFTFPRRGAQALAGVRLASVYPFSFFIRYKTVPVKNEFTVFPRPVAFAPALGTEAGKKARGEHVTETKGYDGDILSIREYMTGDSRRYINWKASARSGSLKINELSAGSTEPLIIEFERIPIPETELKLSCLTFLILNAYRKNRAVGLRLGKRFFPPAVTKEHKLLLLTALALHGQEAADRGR